MKILRHYLNSPGFKRGYNGYFFKPEDWVYKDFPNRLSTKIDQYRKKEYGSMTSQRIIDLFYDFCPYEVLWKPKSEPSSIISRVSNSFVDRYWMTDNLIGYYRDLLYNDTVSFGQKLGMHRSCVRFQCQEDAVLFKLTWVNG